MRNRILYYSIFILFGVSTSISAQGLHKLKPLSFYQEWSLVSINSSENLRVYKPKDNSSSRKSNNSSSVLKFRKRSRVFYSITSKPTKKVRPLNWSNVPTELKPVIWNRCGNDNFIKKNKVESGNVNTRYSKKGTWKVFSRNDAQFLVLKHLVSVNNTGYTLDKKEVFQIVSLEKDKMALRKIKHHEEKL